MHTDNSLTMHGVDRTETILLILQMSSPEGATMINHEVLLHIICCWIRQLI